MTAAGENGVVRLKRTVAGSTTSTLANWPSSLCAPKPSSCGYGRYSNLTDRHEHRAVVILHIFAK